VTLPTQGSESIDSRPMTPPDPRSWGGSFETDLRPNKSHLTAVYTPGEQQGGPQSFSQGQCEQVPAYTQFFDAGLSLEPWRVQLQTGTDAGDPRRKPPRAQQACLNCRRQKSKCSEAFPCSHCQENGLECAYQEPVPPKKDKGLVALEAKVDSLEAEMITSFRRANEKLDRILEIYEDQQSGSLPLADVLQAPAWNHPSLHVVAETEQNLLSWPFFVTGNEFN
jgi:hypothetical protein